MEPHAIFAHWDQIRTDLITTIEAFTEDELAIVPFEKSWQVGQIMLHIADAEDGWLRYVITKEIDEWPRQYSLTNFPDKNAILQALEAVHQRTKQFIAGLSTQDLGQMIVAPWGGKFTLMWILWHIIEHEIHHRGELSLLLGYLGRGGLDV